VCCGRSVGFPAGAALTGEATRGAMGFDGFAASERFPIPARPRASDAGRRLASPAGAPRLGRPAPVGARRAADALGEAAASLTGRAVLRAPAKGVAASRGGRSALRNGRSVRSPRSMRGRRSSALARLRLSLPPAPSGLSDAAARFVARGLRSLSPNGARGSRVSRISREPAERGARRSVVAVARFAARGPRSLSPNAGRAPRPSALCGARRPVSSVRRSGVRRSPARSSGARERGGLALAPSRAFTGAPSRRFAGAPGAADGLVARGPAFFSGNPCGSGSRVRGVLRADGLPARTGARLGEAGRGCLAVNLTRIKSHTAIARSNSVST
jgi:hypothetical protein